MNGVKPLRLRAHFPLEIPLEVKFKRNAPTIYSTSRSLFSTAAATRSEVMSNLQNEKLIFSLLFASSIAVCSFYLAARPKRLGFVNAALSSASQLPILPPKAKKVASQIRFGVQQGQIRGSNPMNPAKFKTDYYNWLRDETRKDETVLSHLRAENDYCAKQTAHLEQLKSTLYDEMLSHLKETDEDVSACSKSHFRT